MTDPDDVKVCLDLMDERWPGYSTAKHIIRKEIEDLRHMTEVCCKQFAKERDELLEAFRHTHRGRRIVSGNRTGKLTDSCADCGFDIRHDIHDAANP